MSDAQETWSLGDVYNPRALDLVLVHALTSAQFFVADALAGKGSLLLDSTARVAQQRVELASLVLKEVGMVLSQLPKGVGIVTPEKKRNVASGFKVPFYTVIDPLDGFEWLELDPHKEQHEQAGGLFACISAVQGNEVIAAYAVDLVTGTLFRVRPQEPERRVVSSNDRQGADVTLLTAENPPASITRSTLLLQGLSLEPHRDLLDHFGALDFRNPIPTLRSRAGNLLEVASGRASAYFRPAGDVTARWIELPLRMFARAAGIRQFELRGDGLHEVSLADSPMKWGANALDLSARELGHGILYVGGRYVTELGSYIQVHTLG